MELTQVIKRPLITEKGADLKEKHSVYIFAVDVNANKIEIKKAVEKLFNVTVERVNTVIVAGKQRRLGLRKGLKPDWKKAYVTLKKGTKIQQLEV
ncbi:MAG: 50S ribosomal protein L23 [Candidatus Firestonebacteria bacterium]